MANTVEERLSTLESAFGREMRSMRGRIDLVVNQEMTLGQKHWGFVALAALAIGIVIGLVV